MFYLRKLFSIDDNSDKKPVPLTSVIKKTEGVTLEKAKDLILNIFNVPLVIFCDGDQEVSEILLKHRLYLIVEKLNFSRNDILIYSKKALSFDISPFAVALVEERNTNLYLDYWIKRNQNFKAFIIFASCEINQIFLDFIKRFKRSNLVWILNHAETNNESTFFQKTFSNYMKYFIIKNENKSLFLEIKKPLLIKKTLYFDSSALELLSFDKCLFFSKKEEILKKAIQTRLSLLKDKFKRVLIFSQIENNFFNSVKDGDSIIFDAQPKEEIINFTLEKLDSIFLAQGYDNGISELFKRHKKEFYIIDFDNGFSGQCTKFISSPFSFSESKVHSLDQRIFKFIKEFNCLVFSEKEWILNHLIEFKINYLSSEKVKTLFLSSLIQNNSWNLCIFKTIFRQNSRNFPLESYEEIIIFEKYSQNLIEFINKCLLAQKKIFILLQGEKEKFLKSFKENCKNFVYLNFDSDLKADVKLFKEKILSLSSEKVESNNFLLDNKLNNYFLEDKCLVFSVNEVILENLVKLKLKTLANKRILLICNEFSKFSAFGLEYGLHLNALDFKSFLAKYCFVENSVLIDWKKDFDVMLSRFNLKRYHFDVVVFFKYQNKHIIKIINKALGEIKDVFVAIEEEPKDILEEFTDKCKKFVYLNFGSSLNAEAKIFTKPILSLSTEKNEVLKSPEIFIKKTKDNVISNQKKEALDKSNPIEKESDNDLIQKDFPQIDKNLIFFTESQKISEKLATHYILWLVNKKGFSKDEILFFCNPNVLNSLDIVSFWEILKALCNNDLTNFYSDNFVRKKVFDSLFFEKKYKAFIFFAPYGYGLILEELVTRVKKENLLNFFFFNSKKFSDRLLTKVKDSLDSYGFYDTKKEKLNGNISFELIEPQKQVYFEEESKDILFDPSSNEEKKTSQKTLKIIEDFSRPLAVLAKDEEISKKLAKERISFLINKLGISKEKIIFCLPSPFSDNRLIDSQSFWDICDKLTRNDLFIMKNNALRKKLFDYASFEKKYEAFIIISSLDCHIAIKELVSRIKGIKNIIWFLLDPKLSAKTLFTSEVDLSDYSKFRATETKNGETLIDTFGKEKTEMNNPILFGEQEDEDPIFSKKSFNTNNEKDSLFDDSEIYEMPIDDENEDISGGLF